jgi:hypothetical protein
LAIILEFRPRPSTENENVGGEAGGGAEILFFTGVRYERWQETDALVQNSAPRSNSPRDNAGGGRTRPTRRRA